MLQRFEEQGSNAKIAFSGGWWLQGRRSRLKGARDPGRCHGGSAVRKGTGDESIAGRSTCQAVLSIADRMRTWKLNLRVVLDCVVGSSLKVAGLLELRHDIAVKFFGRLRELAVPSDGGPGSPEV